MQIWCSIFVLTHPTNLRIKIGSISILKCVKWKADGPLSRQFIRMYWWNATKPKYFTHTHNIDATVSIGFSSKVNMRHASPPKYNYKRNNDISICNERKRYKIKKPNRSCLSDGISNGSLLGRNKSGMKKAQQFALITFSYSTKAKKKRQNVLYHNVVKTDVWKQKESERVCIIRKPTKTRQSLNLLQTS